MHWRNRAALLCFLLLVGIGLHARQVLSQQTLQPASMVITTDGTTATIETSGGDVGYPGPSQVIIEQDSLGIVIVSRSRFFIPLKNQIYLPLMRYYDSKPE